MPSPRTAPRTPATAAPAGWKRADGAPDAKELLALYRHMKTMRLYDERVSALYKQGKIVGGAYSGRGNEATAVGTAAALGPGDWLFPMHRDLGAHLVRGQSVLNLMLQQLGRDTSLTRGRDGTSHYTDPALRIYGNISHLGAMIPVACGAALASKLRGEKLVAMTYIGDGGASVGEVHEGLMMASVMKLPFVLIVENNQYAYSTPVAKQFTVERLAVRAQGYGIPGVTVDGTDVLAVLEASREAVARARGGKGPTMIESVTMRMEGHAAHDNAWYVPKRELELWKKKDPIARFEEFLEKTGVLASGRRSEIINEIVAVIDAAVTQAMARPYPPGSDAGEGVFAE